MKKFLAILLATMLIAAMLPFSVFAGVQEDALGNFNEGTGSALNMYNADFDKIGSLISTVAPAVKIAIGCPSWSDNVGSLTVTLWKWNTDYKTTVAADPMEKKEFVDYEDNAMLGFDFTTPVEAGLYYVELSDAVDESGSGVGPWTGGAYGGQAVFRDGEYVPGMSLRMQVDYKDAVEGKPYGELPKLDKPDNGMGGDSMFPADEYIVMAEDDNALSFETSTDNTVIPSVTDDGTLLFTIPSGSVDSKQSIDLMNIGIEDIVSCAEYPIIAMRVKLTAPKDFGDGEAFMYTSSISGATGGYSTTIKYDYTNTDWQTICIDPTANKTFQTNAVDNEDCWLGFRFDVYCGTPTEESTLEIQWIAFFQSTEAAMAFDGDFSNLPTPVPPTSAPTEAPKTDAPNVDVKTDSQSTEAPATEKPAEKKGCGSVIAGGIAVVSVMAAAAVILRKKED